MYIIAIRVALNTSETNYTPNSQLYIFLNTTHLCDRHVFKRLVSQRPYLKQHHPIAPHVTLCGVLVVVECLRGCPLDGDLPSARPVVVRLIQVTRKTEISNLQSQRHPLHQYVWADDDEASNIAYIEWLNICKMGNSYTEA